MVLDKAIIKGLLFNLYTALQDILFKSVRFRIYRIYFQPDKIMQCVAQ